MLRPLIHKKLRPSQNPTSGLLGPQAPLVPVDMRGLAGFRFAPLILLVTVANNVRCNQISEVTLCLSHLVCEWVCGWAGGTLPGESDPKQSSWKPGIVGKLPGTHGSLLRHFSNEGFKLLQSELHGSCLFYGFSSPGRPLPTQKGTCEKHSESLEFLFIN